MSDLEQSDLEQNNQSPVFEANDLSANQDTVRYSFIELIYGILFAPAVTFRKISQDPPLLYGFIVFFTVEVLIFLTSTLIPPDFSRIPLEIADGLVKAGPYLGIIGVLLAFLGWFIQAGVFQLFAEFLGGQGRAIGVLTVLAFADLPSIFIIPFQVIGYFTADSFLGSFLATAVPIIVFVWWAVLLIIGLRETQQFSTGKAVATLLIPAAILGAAVIILGIAVIGIAAPFIAGQF